MLTFFSFILSYNYFLHCVANTIEARKRKKGEMVERLAKGQDPEKTVFVQEGNEMPKIRFPFGKGNNFQQIMCLAKLLALGNALGLNRSFLFRFM